MALDPPKGTELMGQLFNLLTDPDIAFPLEYLVTMICILATWLHLRAGVSQSVANTTLQAIHLIISTTSKLSFLEQDQCEAVEHKNTLGHSYHVHTPFHRTRHYLLLLSYLFLSLFESYPLQMSVEGISKILTVQYISMEV